MKSNKIALIGISLLAAGIASAQAYKMVVTANNDETLEVNVADIKSLVFVEGEVVVEPENIIDQFTDPVFAAAVLDAASPAQEGVLTPEEAAAITELSLAGNTEVTSVAGIENLVGLKKINLQGCTGLTSVDLQHNDNLEFVQVGLASNLEKLNLGYKPALTELYAFNTALKSLDLTGCPALTNVTIANTKIVVADFSANTNLVSLTAAGSALESIYFKNCTALKKLSVTNTTAMSNIEDLSCCPALEAVDLSGCNFKTLSTAANTALQDLTVSSNNELTTLDVSKNFKLKSLWALSCPKLEKVIMTEGQTIPDLWGVSSSIIERVAREWPADVYDALTAVDQAFADAVLAACDTDSDGKLTKEEVTACTSIVAPNLGIKAVDLFYFPELETLDLSGNELTEISLTGADKLANINLSNNQLSEISLSNLSGPKVLNFSNNKLTAFTIVKYSTVELDLSYNQIKDINLQYQSAMTKLNLSHNVLETCNLNSCSKIADLDLSYNNLETPHLRTLSKVVRANLSNNKLGNITQSVTGNNSRITTWTILEEIDLSNNPFDVVDLSMTTTLKAADVTNCPNLTTVYIGENAASVVTADPTAQILSETGPRN